MQEVRVWLVANPWVWQLALAVLAGLLVARLLFGIFFSDRDEFQDALLQSRRPDWVSFFRGELFEHWRQSLRLSIYFLLSGGAGVFVFCWLSGHSTKP